MGRPVLVGVPKYQFAKSSILRCYIIKAKRKTEDSNNAKPEANHIHLQPYLLRLGLHKVFS